MKHWEAFVKEMSLVVTQDPDTILAEANPTKYHSWAIQAFLGRMGGLGFPGALPLQVDIHFLRSYWGSDAMVQSSIPCKW